MASGNGRGFFSGLLIVICFLIGCIFFYWAVEYWVKHNFDKYRYEISKIQNNGTDSWSFWKLDRRTGQVEYCSMSVVEYAGKKQNRFLCIPSESRKEEEERARKNKSTVPSDEKVTVDEDGDTVVTTTMIPEKTEEVEETTTDTNTTSETSTEAEKE